MTNYPPARLAALLLRYAAQLAVGEDTTITAACVRPLRDAGLNMDAIESQARAWACEAQALMREDVIALDDAA